MRRGLSCRVVPLCLALVFLSGLGAQAYGLDRCPHHHATKHHSAPAASAAEVDVPAGGPIDGRSLHVGLPADEAPDHRTGPCTCVGACHAGAATPVATAGLAIHALTLGSAPRRVSAPGRVVLPRSLPYVLPYANGPPPLL